MPGELRVGEEFAGYRIESLIGEGGSGRVYAVRHLVLDRRAALKVIVPESVSQPDAHERFLRESRLVASLDHPCIVPIYDAGEHDGVLYIAMRYVGGRDLSGLVAARGRLDPETTVQLLEQAASALDAAHAAEIVHRDVKPANVLVEDESARVYVTDFGIATTGGSSGLTQAGLFLGTADYAAPEQIEGKPAGTRADVYALGCVAFECLTGKRPFPRDTLTGVLHAHLLDSPPSLAAEGLPGGLDTVIGRALAKSPGERYATCRDLVDDLRAGLTSVSRRTPAATRPGPRTGLATPAPLPHRPGALVGREPTVRELERILTSTDASLVTLIGAGGVGKTRLAVEIAARMRDHDVPVYFIEPAPAGGSEGAWVSIAAALGVELGSAAPRSDALGAALGPPVLLVLDDVTRAGVPSALVGEILSAAAGVRILATGHVPFGVTGERVVTVTPLSLPPVDTADPEELAVSSAVELFVERARAVVPDFALDEENGPVVAEICRRLDGLPLALELATARLRVLSPVALQARLDSGLDVLGGSSDAAAGGLRDTIAWSYHYLDEAEQKLLARLSVFAGGCSLEAAEAVCLGSTDGDLGRMLDLLASLTKSGLVTRTDGRDGEPRFVLLETIREFATERLAELGERTTLEEAHGRYFLALAERAEPELARSAQALWLARLDEERANLAAALDRAVAADVPEIAIRLAASLVRYWSTRGLMGPGRARLEAVLVDVTYASAATLERAYFAAGYAALGLGDFTAAQTHFERSRTLAGVAGDPAGEARALVQLAWLAGTRNDLVRADELAGVALSLAGEDATIQARGKTVLAEVAQARGELDAAVLLFEQGLALRRRTGDTRLIAHSLLGLARTELLRLDLDRAQSLVVDALAAAGSVADSWLSCAGLLESARVSLLGGRTSDAIEAVGDALRIAERRGDRRALVEGLQVVSALLAADGRTNDAAWLAGAAEATRGEIGAAASPAEMIVVERFLAGIDSGEAAADYAAGRVSTLADATVRARTAIRQSS